MRYNRILIIVIRSNGDVLLSSPLINALKDHYPHAGIDVLVNDTTLNIARTLNHINKIHTYSYAWRNERRVNRFKKELSLIRSLTAKYDLAISLTASDRSIFYSILSGKTAIGPCEASLRKSWWKRLLLSHNYPFDSDTHILLNNVQPLRLLNISLDFIELKTHHSKRAEAKIHRFLRGHGISRYVLFHPSAQYAYKMYPRELRDLLLRKLSTLSVAVIVTGGSSALDRQVAGEMPMLENVYDLIGKTSLDEYIALSSTSMAYIGMDTLNMHIAAAQNKRIFALFGPTLLHMWSPWSNSAQSYAKESKPIQHYGNVTVFQGDMPCVPCGKKGCDDKFGKSDCLRNIDPSLIFREVEKWLKSA